MEQNYSLMVQSRANYYTAGSPVQFVRVELLKGDINGEVAVCLTFKNIGTEPLTGLVIHFKCKDASGQILCEDDFYYQDLNAQPGDLFGGDDAVFVSDTPVSSVEIEQDRAFLNGHGVDLRPYKRVPLNRSIVLPHSIAAKLQENTGNPLLTCVPQDVEQGWFCACGAFHPNEENATVCSECGAERNKVKVELTRILEAARKMAERQQRALDDVADRVAPPAPAAPARPDPAAMAAAAQEAMSQREEELEADEPTAAYDPAEYTQEETDTEMERVRRYAPKGRLFDDEEDDEGTQMYDTADLDPYEEDEDEYGPRRGRYADDDEESEDDILAERIIHWAPPITAIVCALIIAVAVIYHFIIA